MKTTHAPATANTQNVRRRGAATWSTHAPDIAPLPRSLARFRFTRIDRPMILPTDIPTRAQLERLLASRGPWSVSIYLPTDPSSRGEAERIELKNLAGEASRQLQQAGASKADVAAIDEELADLVDDDEFWRYQARSLALFVTPTTSTTFRLANNLTAVVEVSDRFHLKPLLRAITFPHSAFVLALSQNGVRLLEIAPDLEPAEIQVPDLPKDV